MTRKDYILIAGAVAKATRMFQPPSSNHYNGARWVGEFLGDALEKDNPRFDRERFLKACGVAS
jgi:hypothetical protein